MSELGVLTLSNLIAVSLYISAARSFIPSLHRLFWTLTPLFGYFLLLSYVPLPVALSSSHGSASLLAAALSRLAVLGTVMLGLLSGFGAVSTSWGYFPFVCGHRGLVPCPCPFLRNIDLNVTLAMQETSHRSPDRTRRAGLDEGAH